MKCDYSKCGSHQPATVKIAFENGNGSKGEIHYCHPCAMDFLKDTLDPEAGIWLRRLRANKLTITRFPDVDYAAGAEAYQEAKELLAQDVLSKPIR